MIDWFDNCICEQKNGWIYLVLYQKSLHKPRDRQTKQTSYPLMTKLYSLIVPCCEFHVPQMRQKECKTHVEGCEVVLGGLEQGTRGLSTAALQLADVCERLSRTSWPKGRMRAAEFEKEKTTYQLSANNWRKPRPKLGPTLAHADA